MAKMRQMATVQRSRGRGAFMPAACNKSLAGTPKSFKPPADSIQELR